MSNKTCFVRMPDLTKLDIPEKIRRIPVQDSAIFRDLLNEKRTIATRETGAEPGDYVLVEVLGATGSKRTLHTKNNPEQT